MCPLFSERPLIMVFSVGNTSFATDRSLTKQSLDDMHTLNFSDPR